MLLEQAAEALSLQPYLILLIRQTLAAAPYRHIFSEGLYYKQCFNTIEIVGKLFL